MPIWTEKYTVQNTLGVQTSQMNRAIQHPSENWF